jgi:hypothetical protein
MEGLISARNCSTTPGKAVAGETKDIVRTALQLASVKPVLLDYNHAFDAAQKVFDGY